MTSIDSMTATTMMTEIDEYIQRYNIGDEGKREMLDILNKSLIMISRGILETKSTKEIKKESISKGKEPVIEGARKFKSKKAEEYAEEHNLTLDDFNIAEVSKKDVENKVRDMTKVRKDTGSSITSKSSSKSSGEASSSTSSTTLVKKSKEKVICSGINKKGECCKSVGTIMPDGAKKKYCFRHAEDFRSFECESDSSECEEEEPLQNNSKIFQGEDKDDKKKNVNNKDNSDDDLSEED